jgi:competence protein ComEC
MVPQPPSSFVPHPLAFLSVSFALGILAGNFLSLPLNLSLLCCAITSAAALYCFIKHRAGVASLILMLAFLSAGAALAVIDKDSVAETRVRRFYTEEVIRSGSPVEVTGVVMSAPEPAPDGFYLTLRAEKLRFRDEEHEVSGQVMLFAPVRDQKVRAEYDGLELRYGARLRVMTALSRMESYRNPGITPYTEYLERRDLDATATIKHPLLVERLDDERVFLLLAWLYEWRQQLLSLIDSQFSLETGGVLKASLLGNRHQLSRPTAERFREGGTFHVLVISGLHISFIGGLVLFLMRRVTRSRVWQFVVPVAFLWAYTLAVGAEIAVVRAALMFTVVALAPLLHRPATSLNALGAATIILLIWRPQDLFDPSFHLTFLSVLAIILFGWPLLQKLKDVGEWRPSRETPYPPACSAFWRFLAETLFWSEREWTCEMNRSNYHYRLFKYPLAVRLERLHVQRPLRYAVSAMVISASVQVMLLPLFVLYFHRLPFAALVLNIFVGALMALVSVIALLALLVSSLSLWLAAPLIYLVEGLNWLMVHSVDPFAQAGLASARLPEYTGWASIVYVLYYLPLVCLAVRLARWNPTSRVARVIDKGERSSWLLGPRVAAIALLLLSSVIIIHPYSAGKGHGRLRIDFLDVGQGDAALITMPDGTTLLVDAGGRPRFDYRQKSSTEEQREVSFERDTRSIGEAVVSEYLWWRGLDHVDYILATHADADHIDGLRDIVRNFHVRAALVGRAPTGDSEFARFAATAQENGVPLRIIGRGDLLRFGAVEAQVLWPGRTEDASASSSNNDSVVLRLRFGQRVFLLTGDIEKETENALVNQPDDLRCDVLKVAHHGSKTSSTQAFVKAAHPSYAIIPVGLTSIFGHPHQDVLERLHTSGAQILTTGRSGTITFTTDGNDLKVEEFVRP